MRKGGAVPLLDPDAGACLVQAPEGDRPLVGLVLGKQGVELSGSRIEVAEPRDGQGVLYLREQREPHERPICRAQGIEE
jgi:hypothetical protein